MKLCPFCAEEIQDAAIKCRYCGSVLTEAKAPSVPVVVPPKIAIDETIKRLIVAGKKAEAITLTRERKPELGLAAAKAYVDAVESGTDSKPPSERRLLVIGLGISFVVLIGTAVIAVVIAWFQPAVKYSPRIAPAASSNPSPPPRPSPPPEPTYQLALISAKGYESEYGGYHIIEGQVRNDSNEPLENVMAVGIWSDKDGEFVKSDDALIAYNPILPGQTSPFKTMSSGNPAMSRYRVEFKTLFGGTLAVDDLRKK